MRINHLEIVLHAESDQAGLGGALRLCKLPGDDKAAGGGPYSQQQG